MTNPEEKYEAFSVAIEQAFIVVLSNIHGRHDIEVKCRIVALDEESTPVRLVAHGRIGMNIAIGALADVRSSFQIAAEQRMPVFIEDIANELQKDNPRFVAVTGSARE